MMGIVMSGTCWADKKYNKMTSDMQLVFYSSGLLDIDFLWTLSTVTRNIVHWTCILFSWTGQKQESACLPRRITATSPRQTFPALRPPVLIFCTCKMPEILYGTLQKKVTLFRVSLSSFLLCAQIILWRLTLGVKLKMAGTLEHKGKEGRIILRRILKSMWWNTEFVWHRTGTMAGYCEHGNWIWCS